MATVLVTGGTGGLGRRVVALLREAGHEARVASRRDRPADDPGYGWATVDYRTGDGLDAALDGVDAVVHCAGDQRSTVVDEALVAAARRSGGRPHLVYISIVGADRIPYFYFWTKVAAERVIAESGLPWTVLRTTQFHDFVGRVYDVIGRSPVVTQCTKWAISAVNVSTAGKRWSREPPSIVSRCSHSPPPRSEPFEPNTANRSVSDGGW